MKKSLLLLTGIALLASACNSSNTDDKSVDSTSVTSMDTSLTPSVPVQEKISECYIYTKNRDTAKLKINTENDELTGDLSYSLFEKDSNKGTISGEVKGDTILAEYNFDSEGMRSTREVVFLKRDRKLYEGFGEVEEKNGKTVFKDRSKLKFGDAIVFSLTDCK
ncbi:hypothetical protein HQN86_13410 [Pedobacter panaciterrae]|jgi:hypothetical protein|uniref:hypothetical protein n=1 Tax=Pedobacter panaciterrae TaxID=363849 RepID=UPI00155DBE80|nr:hypothetical protein [Pedobacter panaciterrae]NQX54614.1 hypothetical protein [Pedobacter panaciterrae]